MAPQYSCTGTSERRLSEENVLLQGKMADTDDPLTAAELRRERRKRNILRSSEDRMKKIMGYADVDSSSPKVTSDESESAGQRITRRTSATQNTEYKAGGYTKLSTHNDLPIGAKLDVPAPTVCQNTEHSPDEKHTSDSPVQNDEPTSPKNAETSSAKSFERCRIFIYLILGILVRISFNYPFGENYVQTIMNPFVAVEIAVIGYQRSVGIELGDTVKGGVWLATLVMAGFKPEIIQTYKSVMGTVVAIGSDFALFFFSFIMTHICL